MFTQACYIKRNNSEIRKYLKGIGCCVCPCCNDNSCWLFTIYGSVHSIDPEELYLFLEDAKNGKLNIIECKNESQFKAIASLRDDSDYMQWFVLDTNVSIASENMKPKGTFILCGRGRWFKDLNEDGTLNMFSSWNIPAHKATVKEMMEHFK